MTAPEPSSSPTTKSRRRDALVAAVLGILTVAWMLGVEGSQGIGRDEAQYMRAGEHYWGWFAELPDNFHQGRLLADSFSRSGIDKYWGDNAPDHPVVMKVLYGVSWRLFHRCDCMGPNRTLHPIAITAKHRTLPLFRRESTAFRFPAILFAGLLAALVFRFTRQFAGPAASAVASVLAIAQPHYFFHAQIACFDAPVTTMAFVVGYAYWKSLRSPRWGVACGFLFGIALGTKHNAWLMPAFLVAHYVWMRRGDLRRRRLPPLPLAFVSMALIGPVVFFLHWPWLWHDPLARARSYVQRHMQHEHYNFEYLGRNWNEPPRALPQKALRATFPYVSTAFTVPVTTLALAGAGTVFFFAFARRRRRDLLAAAAAPAPLTPIASPSPSPSPPPPSPPPVASWRRPGEGLDLCPGAFLAAQILGPMSVLAVPSTPIFGGVKHFLTAMPYLAVVAGVGLAAITAAAAAALRSAPRLARALPVAFALVAVAPAIAETQRSHPDGLSHYNMLAGGFAGGASWGMNRQFWGYSIRPMLDWISTHAPGRAIYWHDVMGDALALYVRDGLLPRGLSNTGVGEDAIRHSTLGLLMHERHMALYEGVFWDSYGTTRPAYVREREGVPIVTAYEVSKVNK